MRRPLRFVAYPLALALLFPAACSFTEAVPEEDLEGAVAALAASIVAGVGGYLLLRWKANPSREGSRSAATTGD